LLNMVPIWPTHPCAPPEAQPWGDITRCMARRVSSAGAFPAAGEGVVAPVGEAAPGVVPLFRLRRGGRARLLPRMDRAEAARTAAVTPAEVVTPVAAEDTRAVGALPAVEVEASPAGVVATPAAGVVAPARPQAGAAVAVTTDPPARGNSRVR
jgi:uncharacterized protein (DUF3084 family)